MTNNPRAQAIEKLINVIQNCDEIYEYHMLDEDAKALATDILNALNIEVVSKESELQEGNLAICGASTLGVLRLPHKTNNFSEPMLHHLWSGEMLRAKNLVVINSNNKPAVYVENIGVKL